MSIVACLAWYDEPPEFLYRCVRSLAGVADYLVAFDGAWKHFPTRGWNALSDKAEHDAIGQACDDARLQYEITRPFTGTWKSQVAKRDALMLRAGRFGDWLFVIDGDEYVESFGNLTREQSETDLDVGTVECSELRPGATGPSPWSPIRRVYRAPVRVEGGHHGYRTADGRWLHGDPSKVKLEPTVALPIQLIHTPSSRGEDRNRRAAEYRATRRQLGLESSDVWSAAAGRVPS